MYVLGIESTAHTFGVAIVDDKGSVLANEKDALTTEQGGLIPSELAEHHAKVCVDILNNALEKAELVVEEIGLISFSQGPGIGHALRLGAFFSRVLSCKHKLPLVGVNHCIAHLSIGELKTGAKDPVFLYASGANTQVIAYEGGKYRVFGETLDVGIGNLLDTVAREMGLGFPGGPKIEALAKNSDNFIELPYVVKGMDVSFSGILSNLKQKIRQGLSKEVLAFSLQETVFAMLVEVCERAMAHTGKKELLLGGGVACNTRLVDMCRVMCSERGSKCFVPEKQFLVDNAAMIAWQGFLEFSDGKVQGNLKIKPYWRTDDVEVGWKSV